MQDDYSLHDPSDSPRGIERSAAMIEGQMDPASQSLADALRVSFRVLTIIMIGVVVAFLLTGLKTVEPQEVGIKKVFGRVVGTTEPGLAYTWPFPVGQIETIPINEQSLTIRDFWMHETLADKTKDLLDRSSSASKGLRPGWDGALLTGDRNLLHVKLVCKYAVQDVTGALAVQKNIKDLDEAVRSVTCQATIRAAARQTADGIQRDKKGAFLADVRRQAQAFLNQLTPVDGRPYEAVRVNAVILEQSSWPLRALPAYQKAQTAISNGKALCDQAYAEAEEILNEAAGAPYESLVGLPEQFTTSGQIASSRPAKEGPYDLIGQYNRATDPAETQKLQIQIEQILTSPTIGGKASKIIAEAMAYRTEIEQSAESNAQRFERLLEEYQKAPQFTLERLWADVYDEILSAPTVEKVYLTMGKGQTVYRIKRSSEIEKEIQRELLQRKNP